MTLDALFEELQADLAVHAAAIKAHICTASDQWNVLELLCSGPSSMLIILSYGGDDDIGDQPGNAVAATIFEVTLGYNIGLQLPLGNALSVSTPTRVNFMRQLNDLRKRFLTHMFPATVTSRKLQYLDTKAVTLPDGIPLAAYKIRAKLTVAVEQDAAFRTAEEITP
jgi:hypothetical protein